MHTSQADEHNALALLKADHRKGRWCINPL